MLPRNAAGQRPIAGTTTVTAGWEMETNSIWPDTETADGPNYGIGVGVEIAWLASQLEEGFDLQVAANYGTDGSKVNYKGVIRNAFETGTSSEATAKIRSIGPGATPLAAQELSDIPAYNILSKGAWFNNRIPSVNKAATFGNNQTVELYGYSATFEAAPTAQLLAAVL